MDTEGKKLPPEPEAKVSFHDTISVVLIPVRSEFIKANLAHLMWHNRDEFKEIQHNALTEINEFMEQQRLLGNEITLKEACKILYQSEELVEAKVGSSVNY